MRFQTKIAIAFAAVASILSSEFASRHGVAQQQETCVFNRRNTQVGDISKQAIQCDLDLDMVVSQGKATVSSTSQAITRSQTRKLEFVDIGNFVPTKAIVSFDTSNITLKHGEKDSTTSKQPVAGKSYVVTRDGVELRITDMQGNRPPEEELAIARSNLETFGLPNPIAGYFDKKKMSVGQSVDLPIELAKELLGFQDTVGNVSALKMKLVKIRKMNNVNAAVFETTLVAKNQDLSGLSIELKGQMAIDINSCRTIAINLSGPVAVSETHATKGGSFKVSSKGSLKVAVRAAYGKKTKRVATRPAKSTPK